MILIISKALTKRLLTGSLLCHDRRCNRMASQCLLSTVKAASRGLASPFACPRKNSGGGRAERMRWPFWGQTFLTCDSSSGVARGEEARISAAAAPREVAPKATAGRGRPPPVQSFTHVKRFGLLSLVSLSPVCRTPALCRSRRCCSDSECLGRIQWLGSSALLLSSLVHCFWPPTGRV